ncbi:MAG: thiamine pyrophosphate-dependent dehydrogenase E1 component subunit alpha [Ardenticatenaceae bacterium]|nr:thiamine pyrophosphate-dependent dehydrogenase E1 component subunit alpha [Ardenticatenaceae bacterium]
MTDTATATIAEPAVSSPVDYRELGLSKEQVLQLYELMLTARRLDERQETLQRQGKAHFHISCRGQEATQVGTAYALVPGKDFLHPYYRDTGVLLTVGVTPREILLGSFARANDPASGGRQMPSHWSYRPLNIVTGSSPVATQIPQAVGIAYASKLRGDDAVTYTSFGEGGSSKGDFHEGLNFAAIWKLPVIFICENNRYAISVRQEKQMAIENVADRAAGYGMPGVVVDGQDVLAVYQVMKEAVERARSRGGPTLIEAKTYRIVPHSSDDDDRLYRSRDEVKLYRTEQDPINRLHRYILERDLASEEELQAIEGRVMRTLNEATDWAEKQPEPSAANATKHVYRTANGN